MTLIAVIRHAPTEWNAAGRIQGRADTEISAVGRRTLATWKLPGNLAEFAVRSSPLRRAVATAHALFGRTPTIDRRLIEMDWGQWEGRTLTDIRAEFGAEMAASESLGLDFRPLGGESPRDVQARIAPLLAEISASGTPQALVTHKGVLRAIFASATGWDMKDKPPYRLQNGCVHTFLLEADGTPRADRINLPLEST